MRGDGSAMLVQDGEVLLTMRLVAQPRDILGRPCRCFLNRPAKTIDVKASESLEARAELVAQALGHAPGEFAWSIVPLEKHVPAMA